MSALAFLVSIMFIPGLPSAATTPRWALMSLVVPFFWYFTPSRWTVGHLLGAMFLAWCSITLLWTFNGYDGVHQVWKFVLLGMLFCIGAARDLRPVYIGVAFGMTLNSGVVIAQFLGWDNLPQIIVPGGLFFNKNFGAELAAMTLAAAIGSRLWWAIPGVLPTLILCDCRGAYMALGVASILLVYQYNRRAAAFAFLFVGLVGAYLWQQNYTTAQRVELWQDTWAGMTFWGRGIGSYFITFPEHASNVDALALRPFTAHNDLLQIAYETGPGAILAGALVLFALWSRPRVEHYVLIVFLVEGLVGFPLYMPATAFLAAFVLGRLCGDRDELRNSLARCRDRVFLGEAVGHDRRAIAGLFARRSGAVAVRPPYSLLGRLFLHVVPAVRHAEGRDPRYRPSPDDQPLCGRPVGGAGGVQTG